MRKLLLLYLAIVDPKVFLFVLLDFSLESISSLEISS